jgi:hypothetical protein
MLEHKANLADPSVARRPAFSWLAKAASAGATTAFAVAIVYFAGRDAYYALVDPPRLPTGEVARWRRVWRPHGSIRTCGPRLRMEPFTCSRRRASACWAECCCCSSREEWCSGRTRWTSGLLWRLDYRLFCWRCRLKASLDRGTATLH